MGISVTGGEEIHVGQIGLEFCATKKQTMTVTFMFENCKTFLSYLRLPLATASGVWMLSTCLTFPTLYLIYGLLQNNYGFPELVLNMYITLFILLNLCRFAFITCFQICY